MRTNTSHLGRGCWNHWNHWDRWSRWSRWSHGASLFIALNTHAHFALVAEERQIGSLPAARAAHQSPALPAMLPLIHSRPSLHAVDAASRTRARTPDTPNSPNSPSTDHTAPPSASPRLSPWNGAEEKSTRTTQSQRERSSRRPPPANSERARSQTNPSLSSMKRPEWKEGGFLECRESPRFRQRAAP